MIRTVRKEDLNKINEFTKYFNYEINVDDLNNHPFSKYILLEIDDKIIGYLDYSIYYNRIEINYIYIENSYRNKGYASLLLNYITNECIKNNYINITLEVSEKNISAINLYKKNNFLVASRRTNYYKDADALLMIREFGEQNEK